MKWVVQINGDARDLKELTKSLTDCELCIIEKNGQYFLESSQFDNVDTSDGVSSLASDILSVLTGAVRLSLGGRTPLHIVNIARVRTDGGRDIFVPLSGTSYSGGLIDLEITRSDGTVEEVNPADNVPGWVKLGLIDLKVAKALRLFGTGEHDWVSLYRLYEVIEEDVGGIDNIVRNGWATKPSIKKRFKRTANSPGAVGDVSRHGKESKPPPPDPMDLCEARALVEFILHNWLRSKMQKAVT